MDDVKDLLKSLLQIETATLNELESTIPLEGVIELIINSYKVGRLHALKEVWKKNSLLKPENHEIKSDD